MKKVLVSLAMAMVLSAASAQAQDLSLDPGTIDSPQRPAEKQYTLTPEMYRYLSDLQRYGGPTDVTRQRAMQAAEARKQRLASLKWYGHSNSRPMAAATPFMGDYSPRWMSNSTNPYEWRDRGHHQTYISSGGVPLLR